MKIQGDLFSERRCNMPRQLNGPHAKICVLKNPTCRLKWLDDGNTEKNMEELLSTRKKLKMFLQL